MKKNFFYVKVKNKEIMIFEFVLTDKTICIAYFIENIEYVIEK